MKYENLCVHKDMHANVQRSITLNNPPKKHAHTHTYDTNVHVWANEKKKRGEEHPNNGILFSNENE